MYEDPNVTERYITVLFTFASDDENDALMRDALTRRIEQVADAEGCDVEIQCAKYKTTRARKPSSCIRGPMVRQDLPPDLAEKLA